MKDVVIVGLTRTAVGTFGGEIKDVHPADLGATAIKGVLEQSGIDKEVVDEVVMGSVGQYAENAFIARMCALRAGIPANGSGAYTVNRLCGSGLQAINNAVQQIQTNNAEVIIAGGTESMDAFPYYVRKGRYGNKFGHDQLEDGLLTALTDPFGNYQMGVTAENVANRYNVSREDQDEFAYQSTKKALNAIDNGYFESQISPIERKDRKGNVSVFNVDEHPRRNTTLEKLSSLRPAFKENGTVTPGNSSGINNGAAALVLMSRDKANSLGLKPIASIKEQAVAGVDPEVMGIAPAPAVKQLLNKSGLTLEEIDLMELNEAFAAQSLAVIKELDIDPDKVNVNGGAIALGHPIGASGGIITVKLIHELKRRGLKRGISTMCIGGGQGIATIFEIE
ncbi:thiolase family protein [Guptibacillus hwajinpoensis]|uniref:thiolase family protein n=1 Tax=Guptibacillus hwajinpoensis TaxID=208199 RepID=UPI001CFE9114|nr:thiolase family protein [Pseudalkalibacillus hwajinpoensis]WLR61014.1 thiolase family protein [Pseudalkalibacillus hwajinpoensis]